MTFNLSKYKKELLFIPLGGSEEIGMNLNVYVYKEKFLIIDVGIGFSEIPGVDSVLPNIEYLKQKRDKIVGIVLTHAHEDHIGGLPYLWSSIGAPIYTGGFTADVIRQKFLDSDINAEPEITEIDVNKRYDIGPFNIEAVGITHSIPEMHGIVLRTKVGNIFHTGDWNLDDNPTVGDRTNTAALERVGKEGILAMVTDSTNVFRKGRTGSEGVLQESISKLVGKYKGRLVIITTFASNIGRLKSCMIAAQKNGRKVVLMGRAMWRMYTIAKDHGYFDGLPQVYQDKHIQKIEKENLMVIATGSQGEELAVINKLSTGAFKGMQISDGDVIIFSSKIIPGNEKRIYAMFNRLAKLGAVILSEMTDFVHVSGHPSQDDLAAMYSLIKPRIAIPVHGECIHIKRHVEFAKQFVQATIAPYNGCVISISEDGPRFVGSIKAAVSYVDGAFLLSATSPIFKLRKKIASEGVLFISYTAKTEDVSISAPGLLDDTHDKDLLEKLEDIVRSTITKRGASSTDVKTAVVKFIKKFMNKSPKVIVHSY